ncbi:DUF5977 domain-containing protein [Pedobacter psychroterrae]|uniref:DUF5977 domain-containing protein n=1 Tax=Pedobacter psychroterrae TaxID=2530453 RepID=A0A4R0NAV5_9SPHI|nr:DUF5977 domain-containing protein [Pedobacter psychroterrae]TCC96383.1 hypothetical protein EZ437_21385 [Pedobacter psychroterrae]
MKLRTLLVIICLLSVNVDAQVADQGELIARASFRAKQVVQPSPIAAELGRFGDTQVGFFTGTPNINVPLYELKGNKLSLPVSLNYNASGYRPQDPATWVGANWSLDAGGVVVKSVLGNPDITSNYFESSTSLTPPPYGNKFGMASYITNIREAIIETQPDNYYYNFSGRTGKFWMKPDYSILKKKKDMLQISYNSSSPDSRFYITDEKGNIYSFTQIETSITIPSDDVGSPHSNGYTYASSWFLSSIASADGQEQINFEYITTTGEQNLYVNALNNQSYTYKFVTNNLLCPVSDTEDNFVPPPTNRIKRKFLSKVTLVRNGQTVAYIDFNSAVGRQDSEFAEDRLLNQVKVYSVNNGVATVVKQYNLTYSYFINNSNTFEKKRLKLDAVQEMNVSTGTGLKPAFQFTYRTDIAFPDRYTAKIDHWGFFNDSGNSNSIVPNFTVGGWGSQNVTFGGGADREPSLQGSSCTMMTRMQYPTGGFSDFEYELNQAPSGATVRNVGGIRIKSISDYAMSGQLATKKKYTYTKDDGTSSGHASYPVYLKTTSFTDYDAPSMGSPVVCRDYDKFWTIHTISANSIFGLGTFQGSHIGYEQVSESLINPADLMLGRTLYRYNIGTLSEHDDDIRNGDLLRTATYNNAGKLLHEVINSYEYGVVSSMSAYLYRPEDHQTNKPYYCRSSDNVYRNYAEWEAVNPSWGCIEFRTIPTVFFLEDYNIPSRYSNLLSTEEKNYDQATDTYQLLTRAYAYDNPVHTYPTRIMQSSINNTQLVTAKKYAADFNTSGASDVASTAISRLNSINAKGTEIEILQYRQNSDGSNRRYVDGMITTYSGSLAPNPDKVYRMESVTPLTTVQNTTIASGLFTFDPSYKLSGSFNFASDGTLSEQSKAAGPLTAYIWEYNTRYPVASAINAPVSAIAYTSFETDAKGNWSTVNITVNTSFLLSGKRSATLGTTSLISKSFTSAPSQLLLSYWSRSGQVQVSGNSGAIVTLSKQGITVNGWTYYEYLFPIGTTTVQLKVTSGQAIIDEVRLHPADSQMETFAYTPEIGQNTRISASNEIEYYEYDAGSRLINIKNDKKEVLKNFSYNYGPGIAATPPTATLFYSAAAQQNFTKQGCATGTPEVVTYKVPFGKYTAASQPAANLLAQQDITANGQAYANTNGRCLFYNVQKSRKVFKNDCPPEQGLGSPVTYIVPAGTYLAETQAAADALALADLDANGQAYANTNGTCSCAGEGKKMINGTCETGTKIYLSSTGNGSGQYVCVYWYQFSDNTYSIQYSQTSPTPCVNN